MQQYLFSQKAIFSHHPGNTHQALVPSALKADTIPPDAPLPKPCQPFHDTCNYPMFHRIELTVQRD
jgi:hypothetical protein